MTVTVETALLPIASGGGLFDGWQISRLSGGVERLSGRVDSMESTLQTVVTVLASGGVHTARGGARVTAEGNA